MEVRPEEPRSGLYLIIVILVVFDVAGGLIIIHDVVLSHIPIGKFCETGPRLEEATATINGQIYRLPGVNSSGVTVCEPIYP